MERCLKGLKKEKVWKVSDGAKMRTRGTDPTNSRTKKNISISCQELPKRMAKERKWTNSTWSGRSGQGPRKRQVGTQQLLNVGIGKQEGQLKILKNQGNGILPS